MEIEKLIEALGDLEMCAYGYNINGEVLGMDCTDFERLMADAAEEISKIPALQAENDRLKRERNEAVECCSGYCTSCCFEHDCAKHDMNDAAPTRWYYGDCEDWEWQGVKEE